MALNNQNAYLYAGDNAVLNYAITDESNNPLNLTGASLTYIIAAHDGAAAIITKTTADGGITVTNAAGGLLSVSLASADTTNLSGMLWQQLVMTDATLSTGTITFEQRSGNQTTTPPTQTPPTTVVFEYQSWAFLFPELATSVSPGQAAGYFARAELIVGNSSRSRIQDIPTRTMILYLATAHIATMNATVNGQAPSQLVGRISSATEGSVSVSTEMNAPGSAGWWATSRYGYEAYSAMAPYRTFHYAAHPTRVVQPYPPYGFMSWR
jgi:hypothetical protein